MLNLGASIPLASEQDSTNGNINIIIAAVDVAAANAAIQLASRRLHLDKPRDQNKKERKKEIEVTDPKDFIIL